MWNQLKTDVPSGMSTETITLKGAHGDQIAAYLARPLGGGPFPGVVLAHHAPGWDEFSREMVRRFADHGYAAICPDLFARLGGHGTPEEVAANVRGVGGVPDDDVVADLEAGMRYLKSQPYSNGKVGIIGPCSGGRHAYLTACRVKEFDACVDLWGGGVVMAQQDLTPKRPVAPIDLTKDLACPLLGLFGEEDMGPPPAQVAQHEEELKRLGKNYEFHMYPGAGHGFFYYDRANYRQQQAMDGWGKVFTFFATHLQ